jgi:hypothetical protein
MVNAEASDGLGAEYEAGREMAFSTDYPDAGQPIL